MFIEVLSRVAAHRLRVRLALAEDYKSIKATQLGGLVCVCTL